MAVSQHLSRYVLSVWQISCGLALIFEQSQIYRACNNPQAGRVAELAGLAWLCFGVLAFVMAWHPEEDSLIANCVLWSCVLFNAAFSMVAGPYRLTAPNPREKILVPFNTVIVAWVTSTILRDGS